ILNTNYIRPYTLSIISILLASGMGSVFWPNYQQLLIRSQTVFSQLGEKESPSPPVEEQESPPPPPPPVSEPRSIGIATVITEALNVRSGPSTEFPVIGVVHQGEAYKVLEMQDGWLLIGDHAW